jgi:hypothetical protein
MSQPILFRCRHYQAEIILLCVRWYLRYSLSYRDLEEMMVERSLSVDHTTIYRRGRPLLKWSLLPSDSNNRGLVYANHSAAEAVGESPTDGH